jgi:hypothetical protein
MAAERKITKHKVPNAKEIGRNQNWKPGSSIFDLLELWRLGFAGRHRTAVSGWAV